MSLRPKSESEITALLVAPDRVLAGQLLATLPQTHAFQILADLKSYPQPQTLEIRVRQLKPAVILLDLVSDPAQALELVRFASGLAQTVLVVGLHTANDAQAILQSLRAGASEFLYAPFELATQREAVSRLRRMCQQETVVQNEAGHLIAFCSSKPGSGASTIATQTAFALHKQTGKRVLLADCDLTGGTIGFYLKLTHNYSLMDALQHAEHLDPALWSSLTVNYGGVDILPAPAAPNADALDGGRLRVLAEQARWMYDWVILDLPTVFSRNSLVAASECEQVFVVSTAELPSLHLTRKAMAMVAKFGFARERFEIIVNRVDKRDEISAGDMDKLFGCAVYACLPNDYFALHRVVTLGQPLGPDGELGRAIENMAQRLNLALGKGKKNTAPQKDSKPALVGQA